MKTAQEINTDNEEYFRDIVAEVLADNKFSYPYADDLEIVDCFGGEITDHMSLERFVYELYDKIINVLEMEK